MIGQLILFLKWYNLKPNYLLMMKRATRH